MKKLAFSVLAAVLLISACKKDDDNETAASSFVMNGNTVVTPYGYLFDYNSDGKQVVFTDLSITDSTTAKLSAFSFDIDTLIDGASYTLLDRDSASFDRTKNFEDAFAIYKADFVDGEVVDTTGTWLKEPTSGTVTIKKSGDNYTIGYSIQFATSKVTGKYVGKLSLQE
jgi:hypothetical protein